MKNTSLTLGILMISMIACKPNKSLELDYCEMLTRDQSYVNHDETDKAVVEENKRKRSQIFVENYEQLIALTKREGFPSISFENLPQDSCKYWAITITLIHIAQTKPETFFSEEAIALFEEEIEKGNIDSEDLAPAFRVSLMTNEFCDDLQGNIEKAIQIWGMEPYLNVRPKFKKCN